MQIFFPISCWWLANSVVSAAVITDHSETALKIYSEYFTTNDASSWTKSHPDILKRFAPSLSFDSLIRLLFKLYLTSDKGFTSEAERQNAVNFLQLIKSQHADDDRVFQQLKGIHTLQIPRSCLKRLRFLKDSLPAPKIYGDVVLLAELFTGRKFDVFDSELHRFVITRQYYRFPLDFYLPCITDNLICLLWYDTVDADYVELKRRFKTMKSLECTGIFHANDKHERQRIFVAELHQSPLLQRMITSTKSFFWIDGSLLKTLVEVAIQERQWESTALLLSDMPSFQSYRHVRSLDVEVLSKITRLMKRKEGLWADWYNMAKHHPTRPSDSLARHLVELELVKETLDEPHVPALQFVELPPEALYHIIQIVLDDNLFTWTSLKLVCKQWNQLLQLDRVLETDDRFYDRFIGECAEGMSVAWRSVLKTNRQRTRLMQYFLSNRPVKLSPQAQCYPNISSTRVEKLDQLARLIRNLSSSVPFALWNQPHMHPIQSAAVLEKNYEHLCTIMKLAIPILVNLIDNIILPYCSDHRPIMDSICHRVNVDKLREVLLRRHLMHGCHAETIKYFFTSHKIIPTLDYLIKLSVKLNTKKPLQLIMNLIVREIVRGGMAVSLTRELIEEHLDSLFDAVFSMQPTVREFKLILDFLTAHCPGLMSTDPFITTFLNRLISRVTY